MSLLASPVVVYFAVWLAAWAVLTMAIARIPPVRNFFARMGLSFEFCTVQWSSVALGERIYAWGCQRRRALLTWFHYARLCFVLCGALALLYLAFTACREVATLFSALVTTLSAAPTITAANAALPEAAPALATVTTATATASAAAPAVPALALALPGVTLPLSALPLFACAVLAAVSVHELGHALAAAAHGVPVGRVGAFWALLFPGAYVQLPDAALLRPSPRAKLTVIAAGVWHNVLLALAAAALAWLLTPSATPLAAAAPAAAVWGLAVAPGDAPLTALLRAAPGAGLAGAAAAVAAGWAPSWPLAPTVAAVWPGHGAALPALQQALPAGAAVLALDGAPLESPAQWADLLALADDADADARKALAASSSGVASSSSSSSASARASASGSVVPLPAWGRCLPENTLLQAVALSSTLSSTETDNNSVSNSKTWSSVTAPACCRGRAPAHLATSFVGDSKSTSAAVTDGDNSDTEPLGGRPLCVWTPPTCARAPHPYLPRHWTPVPANCPSQSATARAGAGAGAGTGAAAALACVAAPRVALAESTLSLRAHALAAAASAAGAGAGVASLAAGCAGAADCPPGTRCAHALLWPHTLASHTEPDDTDADAGAGSVVRVTGAGSRERPISLVAALLPHHTLPARLRGLLLPAPASAALRSGLHGGSGLAATAAEAAAAPAQPGDPPGATRLRDGARALLVPEAAVALARGIALAPPPPGPLLLLQVLLSLLLSAAAALLAAVIALPLALLAAAGALPAAAHAAVADTLADLLADSAAAAWRLLCLDAPAVVLSWLAATAAVSASLAVLNAAPVLMADGAVAAAVAAAALAVRAPRKDSDRRGLSGSHGSDRGSDREQSAAEAAVPWGAVARALVVLVAGEDATDAAYADADADAEAARSAAITVTAKAELTPRAGNNAAAEAHAADAEDASEAATAAEGISLLSSSAPASAPLSQTTAHVAVSSGTPVSAASSGGSDPWEHVAPHWLPRLGLPAAGLGATRAPAMARGLIVVATALLAVSIGGALLRTMLL